MPTIAAFAIAPIRIRAYDPYTLYMFWQVVRVPMGIVKIDDELHEQARRASVVMCRSINAQTEFWMKIGMLAEASPTLSFNDIVRAQFLAVHVNFVEAAAA